MKLFIDTANIADIQMASISGVVAGVTTNPTLIAKEGRDFKAVIEEIVTLIDGPISAEVVSLGCDEMVKEAIELIKIHKNIVIKLPMTKDGVSACSILSKKGIKTNVTLVFTANQALLAGLAGATYVSPFVGRLSDLGEDPFKLIKDIADIFKIHNIDTNIIAASIRDCYQVTEVAKYGAHVATIPTKVLNEMYHHHLTDQGIEKFMEDWKNYQEELV